MKRDDIIFDIIEKEHQRQLKGIELIASENFAFSSSYSSNLPSPIPLPSKSELFLSILSRQKTLFIKSLLSV